MLDFQDVEIVGIQLSKDGRLWVCVDGACVLRVKRAKEGFHITDDRQNLQLLTAIVTAGLFANEDYSILPLEAIIERAKVAVDEIIR
jgi:hypothetical protein